MGPFYNTLLTVPQCKRGTLKVEDTGSSAIPLGPTLSTMNALLDPAWPALTSNGKLFQDRPALQHQQSPNVLVPRKYLSGLLEELIYRRDSH
ncbi:CheY-like superfamily [Penicillium argentinense]|uniref:CheY-like superfamily n=1 Tax=Penicillium argentinense TaxID=1131581 RepID=A0A9W9G1F8_9EURO|nr:CheY-like superfamily [Penicillium argentinense]KAJ5110223.1 CheY-like superfamily [Penicillium argentinense]